MKDAEVRSWIQDNKHLLSISATILAIVHPEQYEFGMKVLEEIHNHPEKVSDDAVFEEIMLGWGCPFSQFTVSSNAEVFDYRSLFGKCHWVDVFLSLGNHRGGTFALGDVGAIFEYKRGTAIGICSWILRHGVSETTSGNRMSFKFTMRDNIAHWMGVNDTSRYSTPHIAV